MVGDSRIDDWAGPGGELDQLMLSWRPLDAIRRAREIIHDSADRYVRCQARLFTIAAMINIGRVGTRELDEMIERTHHELESVAEPAPHAEFDALRGTREALLGNLDEAVVRAASARRELDAGADGSLAACVAWRDLANLESALRMSDRAALSRARATEFDRLDRPWQDLGLLVETALIKDHHGDTDGCVAALDQAAVAARRRLSARIEAEAMADTYSGYALARLAALHGDAAAAPSIPRRLDDPFTTCFRAMTNACLAIARGDHHRALRILGSVSPVDRITGVEVLRLRSLAHAGRGEHTAAWLLEREMFHVVTQDIQRLRALVVDSARTIQDRAALERLLRERENDAFTDRLTGLSNRRHFDIRWTDATRPRSIVVGMLDLDNFKTVNTVHGHRVGDLVLRRAAALLRDTLRGEDFLARFGGDEFVAVLVDTPLDQARLIGRRLSSRLARENWSALAPGTPIGVSVGWSEVPHDGTMAEALRVADAAMYSAKSRR